MFDLSSDMEARTQRLCGRRPGLMPERWHCYILWAQIPVFTSGGKGLVFSADGVWLKVNLVPSVSIAENAF